MKETLESKRYFSVPMQPVLGIPSEDKGYIFERLDNFLHVRKIYIKGIKTGESVDICQITDLHFNYLNAEDFAEKNPAVMSSRERRVWMKGGASLHNALNALEYGSHCDAMVITGDILDYFTRGAMEYTKRYIWDMHPDAIACLGGHDVTCKMQGSVPDNIPLEEKYKMLQDIWNHDLLYYSKVINGSVMIIQMNNDLSSYTEEQYKKLSHDIERARAEELTVLIFQHEPISTGNPLDTDVEVLCWGDKNASRDFYNNILGDCNSNEITKKTYDLIVNSADVIKGIFCGHLHNDFYTEVLAKSKNGESRVIPQYVLIANAYEHGNVLHIVVE